MKRRVYPVAAMLFASAIFAVGCSSDSGGETEHPPDQATTTTSPAAGGEPVVLDPEGRRFNPSEIYADTIEGVVSVRAIYGDPATDIASASGAEGSGFVYGDRGGIITNAHVVSNGTGENRKAAPRVYVEFSTGDILEGKVVGLDPFADVALISVDPNEVDLKPLELADSRQVVVGEPIAVIGSPFGEDQTLTTGIVSQTGRSVMSLTDFMIEGAIQTDASINPGNSGGPMLNAEGKVIGISQQMKSGSGASNGVGFGVPSNSIKRSAEMLRREGSASYAYIGVSTQPMYPQLAERLGIEAETGAIVAEVVDDGPADQAGIRGSDKELFFQGAGYDIGGDVIVAVNGQQIQHAEDLGRIVGRLKPGDSAQIEVVRDGNRKTIEVELGDRPTAVTLG